MFTLPFRDASLLSAAPARADKRAAIVTRNAGNQSLTDRSRCPYRYAYQLPFQRENLPLTEIASTPVGQSKDVRITDPQVPCNHCQEREPCGAGS
jgi:hypothetical protein